VVLGFAVEVGALWWPHAAELRELGWHTLLAPAGAQAIVVGGSSSPLFSPCTMPNVRPITPEILPILPPPAADLG
jgi:hypothetical protein